MSSTKKLTRKGSLRQVYIRVYRLEICTHISHTGIRPSFVKNVAPLTSLVQLSPPRPPLPCVNEYTVYTFTVCKGRRFGVLLETIFWRSLTLCIRPDTEPTKLLHHPKQKPRRVGASDRLTPAAKIPLQVVFLHYDILLWSLCS
jgi:hypothetical protein